MTLSVFSLNLQYGYISMQFSHSWIYLKAKTEWPGLKVCLKLVQAEFWIPFNYVYIHFHFYIVNFLEGLDHVLQ